MQPVAAAAAMQPVAAALSLPEWRGFGEARAALADPRAQVLFFATNFVAARLGGKLGAAAHVAAADALAKGLAEAAGNELMWWRAPVREMLVDGFCALTEPFAPRIGAIARMAGPAERSPLEWVAEVQGGIRPAILARAAPRWAEPRLEALPYIIGTAMSLATRGTPAQRKGQVILAVLRYIRDNTEGLSTAESVVVAKVALLTVGSLVEAAQYLRMFGPPAGGAPCYI